MIPGHNWGADRQSLTDIYKPLIASTIDYGCMVCDTAAKMLLQRPDRILYKAFRLAIGAFKTTPTVHVLSKS